MLNLSAFESAAHPAPKDDSMAKWLYNLLILLIIISKT